MWCDAGIISEIIGRQQWLNNQLFEIVKNSNQFYHTINLSAGGSEDKEELVRVTRQAEQLVEELQQKEKELINEKQQVEKVVYCIVYCAEIWIFYW